MRGDFSIPIYDATTRSAVSVSLNNECMHVHLDTGSDEPNTHRLRTSFFGSPAEVVGYFDDLAAKIHRACEALGIDITDDHEALVG